MCGKIVVKLLRKSEMSLKLLKNFFDDYIDLIKVIFCQTLLVGLCIVNQVNLIYSALAILLFYVIIASAKKFCYLPILIVLLFLSYLCNGFREHLSDKHYSKLLSATDGNGEFTLVADDILYVENSIVNNSKFINCELKNLKLNILMDKK